MKEAVFFAENFPPKLALCSQTVKFVSMIENVTPK